MRLMLYDGVDVYVDVGVGVGVVDVVGVSVVVAVVVGDGVDECVDVYVYVYGCEYMSVYEVVEGVAVGGGGLRWVFRLMCTRRLMPA